MISSKLSVLVLTLGILVIPSTPAFASSVAGVDGMIGAGEYAWNTDGYEGSGKWHTRGGYQEYNDGSGGDPWDIDFLGTNVDKYGSFKIGARGGSILSGSNTYGSHTTLTLSDIAINVVTDSESPTDPAKSSSGWDYALRLMSIGNGHALFDLFSLTDGNDNVVGSWKGSGKYADSTDYDHQPYSYGSTDTFKMENGHLVKSGISGAYSPNAGDDGVLEVSFDLGLLSLFDETTGGKIITYLTMSCANDEAIVHADVSAVPVPAAFWLFGTALIGFIGISRRTQV